MPDVKDSADNVSAADNNADRDAMLALDPAGLNAAIRECARITAPEIDDAEFERIKAENSPRYRNTVRDMERALTAYLRAAPNTVKTIPTCCVTGAIPSDGGACGDCDPCILGEASVPEPVKRIITEKNSLIQRVGELEDKLAALVEQPATPGYAAGFEACREALKF